MLDLITPNKQMTGIQIHYDAADSHGPPFTAFDADAVFERYKHIEFTDAERDSPEELLVTRSAMLHNGGMLAYGWSAREAFDRLKHQ